MKEIEKLIIENVSQLHAKTALPPVLYGEEGRMIRMECTHHKIYYTALIGFL
jgi:hypothetical protein